MLKFKKKHKIYVIEVIIFFEIISNYIYTDIILTPDFTLLYLQRKDFLAPSHIYMNDQDLLLSQPWFFLINILITSTWFWFFIFSSANAFQINKQSAKKKKKFNCFTMCMYTRLVHSYTTYIHYTYIIVYIYVVLQTLYSHIYLINRNHKT